MGRARRLAFVVWAALLSLVVGLTFVVTTALTIGVWLAHPTSTETNPVVDLGFFALGALLVGTGLATQLRGPERHLAGLWQALIGLGALSLAGLLGQRLEPLWGGLLLAGATTVLVALHPARGELLRFSGISARLAILSLLAAGPAAWYAVAMLSLARQAGPSCFFGQCARGDRFAEVAALAVTIVLVGLLAAARPPGWRLSAWAVGAAAGLMGLASIVLPDVHGSVGQAWGAFGVAWGVVFVAVAEREDQAIRSVADRRHSGVEADGNHRQGRHLTEPDRGVNDSVTGPGDGPESAV